MKFRPFPAIRRFEAVALLVCLLAIAACRAQAEEPGLTLSELDDGKTVDASAAKSVLIKLAGNPTTGYSWVVSKVEGNALQQVGGVEYARGGGPGVGDGGVFQATFNVANVGQTKLTMEYRRPWEKDKPPAKTFTIGLKVMDKTTKPTTNPATGPSTHSATHPTTRPPTTASTAPSIRPASAPSHDRKRDGDD